MVRCGIAGHVVSMDVVVFNKMGYKSRLAIVNGDNVIHDKPLKVCVKEPFDYPHKFIGDELGKKGFKFLIDGRVFRKIDKVDDIEIKGEWQGRWWYSRVQRVNHLTCKKAGSNAFSGGQVG